MRFPALLLTLALVLPAAAQRPRSGGGAGGGNNFPSSSSIPSPSNARNQQGISVRLTSEDNQPLVGMVRVELISSTGVVVSDTVARDGMAQFSNVATGSYRLRITGPDIVDTSSDVFSVSTWEKSLQYIRVRMRTTGQTGSMQGTISANELNVPEKAKAERRKGDEQIAKGDWKKAIEHLNKALAIYPQYASACNDLGYAYIKAGDTAKAREAFQKAVDLNEPTGLALLNLARFTTADENYAESIRLLNRSLSLGPANAEALVILANCEYAVGQYAEAVTHARRAHGLAHERLAVTHIIAGMALEALQKPVDAALEYETFLKEDPTSPRAAAAREGLTRVSAQAHPAPAMASTPKP